MGDNWQEGYRKALLGYVVDNGSMLNLKARRSVYSGWTDFTPEGLEKAAHIRECRPDPEKSGPVEDSQWAEFDGTFADPPWGQHYGVDASVTCRCGQQQDIPFRLERSLGEIIQGVVNQPDPRDVALAEVSRLGEEIND